MQNNDSYATWGFVVLSIDADGHTTLHGALWDSVVTNPTVGCFIGACTSDCGAAEISAQVFALLWLLQISADFPNNLRV